MPGDSAVDALRRRHASHRTEADARRRRVYGEERARALEANERIDADAEDPGAALAAVQAVVDGPFRGFGFLSMMDLVLLALVFTVLWLFAKAQHDVDIAQIAWHYLRPHYDDGMFPADSGDAGDL